MTADISAAVVLSFAGLTTTWSAYQGDLWKGEQATHFNEADAFRVLANRASGENSLLQMIDITLFSSWVNATLEGRLQLAEVYRTRFPAELHAAFEASLSQSGPNSIPIPFERPEYRKAARERAARYARLADEHFAAARKANQNSDRFGQANVLLASALFFAGIAQVFEVGRMRLSLVGLAAVLTLIGLLRVWMLPLILPF